MASNFNVLISSAGRRVALLNLFREALGTLGLSGELLVADMSRLSSAFHSADRAFVVPPCRDSSFIPTMLDLCARNAVRLVVPTIDTELPMYAAHREDFEQIGTRVAISSPAVIDASCQKDATHRWLVDNGFPTVRQATVDEVLADREAWPFPLIVKPVGGSASIGVNRVRDRVSLKVATRGADYVVQTVAPGIEHTVDVLCNRQGKSLCAVPRRRLEVRSGEVSKGMTVRWPPLEQLARRICETLPGAYGAFNVQIFLDESTGEMNVIEINARYGGGHPLACAAGAFFPLWMIEEIVGLPSSAKDDEWRDRLVMLRYDDAVFVDAALAGVSS